MPPAKKKATGGSSARLAGGSKASAAASAKAAAKAQKDEAFKAKVERRRSTASLYVDKAQAAIEASRQAQQSSPEPIW